MQRPPRARWRQAGVAVAKSYFALGTLGRAMSWTFNSVADAKWSATAFLQVASCLRHTLLAGCRQAQFKDGSQPSSRAKLRWISAWSRPEACRRLKRPASEFILPALS